MEIVDIIDFIELNNYIKNKQIERMINDISSDDQFYLYTVARMYMKSKDNCVKYYLDKINNKDTEIEMMRGVYALRHEKYGLADEYFKNAFDLYIDNTRVEFSDIKWPWYDDKIPLSIIDRIYLYQLITPYFDYIETTEFFDFLYCQLRFNDAVNLLRNGDHNTAYLYLNAMYNNMQILNKEVIADLRNQSRQIVDDINIQVFDLGTIHHYLGIVDLVLFKYLDALNNLQESIYYRTDADYRDIVSSYANLGVLYLNTNEISDGIHYLEKSLHLVYEYGKTVDMIVILLNLSMSYLRQIKTDDTGKNYIIQSKKYIDRADEINQKYQNTMMQAKILRAYAYYYLITDDIYNAIDNFERILMMRNDDHSLIMHIYYILITHYCKISNFSRCNELLVQMNLIKDNIKYFRYDLLSTMSKIEIDRSSGSYVIIDNLIDMLFKLNPMSPLFNDALMLIINVDDFHVIIENKEFIKIIVDNNKLFFICYLIARTDNKYLKNTLENKISNVSTHIDDNIYKFAELMRSDNVDNILDKIIDNKIVEVMTIIN